MSKGRSGRVTRGKKRRCVCFCVSRFFWKRRLVGLSLSQRRCGMPEMRVFSPIGIANREYGPPDIATTHYKSPPVYLLPNAVTPTFPSSASEPRHSPHPPVAIDDNVPLFPIRPPDAPPTRTNNTSEAQHLPSPTSKGRRCLPPPRPFLPVLLCIFLPELSIRRHRRQSPRSRLSPLPCSSPSPSPPRMGAWWGGRRC